MRNNSSERHGNLTPATHAAPSESGKSHPGLPGPALPPCSLAGGRRSWAESAPHSPGLQPIHQPRTRSCTERGSLRGQSRKRNHLCNFFFFSFFSLSLGVPCTRAGGQAAAGDSVGRRRLPDRRKTSGFLLLPPVLGADVTVPENLLEHE